MWSHIIIGFTVGYCMGLWSEKTRKAIDVAGVLLEKNEGDVLNINLKWTDWIAKPSMPIIEKKVSICTSKLE